MIFVILIVGIAAAAVLGYYIGSWSSAPPEPCACEGRGLPRPTYYGRHDGGIVVGERDEVLVRPVNGRSLGTQPRRTPHPSAADPVTPLVTGDAPPWYVATAQNPALRDQAVVPAYAPPVYGEACELDVAEAERQFALALGPDGCEET